MAQLPISILLPRTSFTMTIEADTVRDFPIDLSVQNRQIRLKLPTASMQTFLFNPGSRRVTPNYTGAFQQFMLAFRMQVRENVICTAVKDHELDISHIYTLSSNISDIYLSRLYPYRGSQANFLKYTGHSRASCRVPLRGQSCSESSLYNVIRIHHRPNRFLYAAHRIQIGDQKNI